ncbi:MAG: DUF6585 family protein [Anaerolineales bacterium]
MTDTDASPSPAPELGTFRKTFLPRVFPGKVLLGSATICVAVGILEFVSALNQYLSPPRSVLSDRFRQDSIMISVILGIVFVLIALSLAVLYYAHIKHRVDLYAEGVVVTTWQGQKTVLWGDLMKVDKQPIYGRSRRPINWNYTLYQFNGEKVQIRGLEGLGVLGKVLEKMDE